MQERESELESEQERNAPNTVHPIFQWNAETSGDKGKQSETEYEK